MNVTACLVTRGDVDMQPVLDSLPRAWEKIIWNNAGPWVIRHGPFGDLGDLTRFRDGGSPGVSDLSVYGRYAAIDYASHDLIYVQDDDVIVSDPQAIVDTFLATRECSTHGPMARQVAPTSGIAVWACDEHDPKPCVLDAIVANMPPKFRHDGYTDSCLVGFGACFHRDAPARAFEQIGYQDYCSPFLSDDHTDLTFTHPGFTLKFPDTAFVRRTCDVVFTTLTPRVLVDVPKTDREMASDPNRMWKQPGHLGERTRMLELARKVRDA